MFSVSQQPRERSTCWFHGKLRRSVCCSAWVRIMTDVFPISKICGPVVEVCFCSCSLLRLRTHTNWISFKLKSPRDNTKCSRKLKEQTIKISSVYLPRLQGLSDVQNHWNIPPSWVWVGCALKLYLVGGHLFDGILNMFLKVNKLRYAYVWDKRSKLTCKEVHTC